MAAAVITLFPREHASRVFQLIEDTEMRESLLQRHAESDPGIGFSLTDRENLAVIDAIMRDLF
jgi:hypothetical protein